MNCVLIDPYANAFNKNPQGMEGHSDQTARLPGVFERKYELDSLASVLKLSVGYYEYSGEENETPRF